MKKCTLVMGSRTHKNTEELIKWCKENNGVLWCRTSHQAHHIREKHGIETISFNGDNFIKGINKPVALDDFFFHPIIMKFLSAACFQARGKIEITLDKEGEVFELKMITEE